jgi:hypothetical protein
MLWSNDALRKSITFLTPGVKLVVKTLPSESFNLIEQLKSLDQIWNFSSSEHALETYFGFWLAGLNKISAAKNYRNENSGTNVQVRLLFQSE